jgi:hypothetical protein
MIIGAENLEYPPERDATGFEYEVLVRYITASRKVQDHEWDIAKACSYMLLSFFPWSP